MSIVYCSKTRRQFLLGAGKSLLAVPLLPSLLPLDAVAQSAISPKRMMLFWFDHNNLQNLWPQRSAATTAVGTSGAREILLRNLGTASTISPVLRHTRYESLKNADQLTILRGFDTAVPYGPGHGNFTLACGEDRNSEGNYPTIDTIVESSRTVYPSTTPASVRKALRVDHFGGGSVFYQKVGTSVQPVPAYTNNIQTFYNEVFSSLTAGTVPVAETTNQLKGNILNKVHASYMSFKNNRRISSMDKARLDQHVEYISNLQSGYSQLPTQPTCARPTSPGNISDPLVYVPLYMDLLAIAFKCGLTKFGTMTFDAHDPQWMPNLGIMSFHDAIHGGQGNAIQLSAFTKWWTFYADMIASRFLAPLEEMEGTTGRSYLQNMVTGMVCAGGMHGLGGDGGHSGIDSQQILIGNMGGAIRSGRYMVMPGTGDSNNLPYNCFLITLLQLMGVTPAEYAFATSNGQGIGYYGFAANHPLRSRFYSPITEILT